MSRSGYAVRSGHVVDHVEPNRPIPQPQQRKKPKDEIDLLIEKHFFSLPVGMKKEQLTEILRKRKLLPTKPSKSKSKTTVKAS